MKNANQKFNTLAINRINGITEKLQDSEAILLSLKAFYDSSDDVTQTDFLAFSRVITKNHPEIATLSWYEKPPFPGSVIKTNSNFKYPLKYRYSNIHNYPNTILINNNSITSSISSNTGNNLLSMKVLETKSGSNHIHFSLPVFSKGTARPTGFLVMIVDLSHLITRVISTLASEPIALSIKFNDLVLALYKPAEWNADIENSNNNLYIEATELTDVANVSLEVHASSTTDQFSSQTYLSTLVFIVGMIITLLLSYIAQLSIKRHINIVEIVDKKTSDLKQAHKLILTQEKQLKSKAEINQRLAEIEHALHNNEMRLYYQPKVNMRTGVVFGVEGLIRWIHPTKGLIPPLNFIPLISGTHLESEVGDWVINQALIQIDNWLKQDIEIEISVNITSFHLQTNSFFSQLKKSLSKFPAVNSRLLQLEIVESDKLGDHKEIGKIIAECRDSLGVHMALDDFGTGYSSLTHLRNLPVKIIKIDQTFIRDMLEDPNDYAIVDGVIGLADSFHREVIAEGVETTAHGLMLLVSGCELAQGYGIAKPMPVDIFSEWLSNYSPNEAWLVCGKEKRTIKEDKVKLFKLIINEWVNLFIKSIQSSPEDTRSRSIADYTQAPCTDWLKGSLQTHIFEQQWLDSLENMNDNLHIIANDLWHKYEEGHIDQAREGLTELHIAFDHINQYLK